MKRSLTVETESAVGKNPNAAVFLSNAFSFYINSSWFCYFHLLYSDSIRKKQRTETTNTTPESDINNGES